MKQPLVFAIPPSSGIQSLLVYVLVLRLWHISHTGKLQNPKPKWNELAQDLV